MDINQLFKLCIQLADENELQQKQIDKCVKQLSDQNKTLETLKELLTTIAEEVINLRK